MWGSYELFSIGAAAPSSARRPPLFRFDASNVLWWALRSAGPYLASEGEGELLLHTRVQARAMNHAIVM